MKTISRPKQAETCRCPERTYVFVQKLGHHVCSACRLPSPALAKVLYEAGIL